MREKAKGTLSRDAAQPHFSKTFSISVRIPKLDNKTEREGKKKETYREREYRWNKKAKRKKID